MMGRWKLEGRRVVVGLFFLRSVWLDVVNWAGREVVSVGWFQAKLSWLDGNVEMGAGKDIQWVLWVMQQVR